MPGRLTVASEPVELSELAEEVAGEFRGRAGDHTIEVATEPVAAEGDAERVLQIGRILLENALVHTPPGTTVRVSTAVDGGRATLTVANDGPEIPREAQQQIFERFYRLDGTRASGQRPRPRDRAGARGGDGRPDRARLAERLDALHARPERRAPNGSSSRPV